jgi:hypothetical protein
LVKNYFATAQQAFICNQPIEHEHVSQCQKLAFYEGETGEWKIRILSNTNSTLYRTPSPISAER